MNGGWGKYHSWIHFLLWCRFLNVLRVWQSRPPSSVSAEDVYGTDGPFSIKHPRLFFYSATLEPCLELFAVILVSFTLSLSPSAICWRSRSQTVLCKSPPPLRPPRSGYSRPLVDLLCVLKLDSLKAVMEIKWGNPQRFLGGISRCFFLCHPLYYFKRTGIMEMEMENSAGCTWWPSAVL